MELWRRIEGNFSTTVQSLVNSSARAASVQFSPVESILRWSQQTLVLPLRQF